VLNHRETEASTAAAAASPALMGHQIHTASIWLVRGEAGDRAVS
jgi:hypothetical protein